MIDLEKEKKNFQNHVATFTDYGNIKILDFQRPGSNEYRIRFLFEEDHYRLHISGDLGELIASNYKNMVFESFEEDFTDNTGYFAEKIDCMNRAIYYYDEEQAEKDIMEMLTLSFGLVMSWKTLQKIVEFKAGDIMNCRNIFMKQMSVLEILEK